MGIGEQFEFEKTGRIEPEHIYHGYNCQKVKHVGEGYLHTEDDDLPYDVDGVKYCGQCHMAIQSMGGYSS